MKVYVVHGFWKYDNGAIELKAFNTEDKAKEYIANFNYKQRIPVEGSKDSYWDEFDYLEYTELELEE